MIKMLVMDVDGTLTDGKIYIGKNGEIMKAFNVKDGFEISKLNEYGIIPVIITGRESEIVMNRATELKIKEIYQGVEDKTEQLRRILNKYNFTYENVAYIGDDKNDLQCMEKCKLRGCPYDADHSVKDICEFIAKNKGGDGAVREFIEYIKNNINLI